jgi:hypothetical protein
VRRSPSKQDTPPSINPKALDVWVHVLRRYADLVFSSRDVDDQWARATKMYERACQSRGIDPYTGKSYSTRIYKISSALRRLACSSL